MWGGERRVLSALLRACKEVGDGDGDGAILNTTLSGPLSGVLPQSTHQPYPCSAHDAHLPVDDHGEFQALVSGCDLGFNLHASSRKHMLR